MGNMRRGKKKGRSLAGSDDSEVLASTYQSMRRLVVWFWIGLWRYLFLSVDGCQRGAASCHRLVVDSHDVSEHEAMSIFGRLLEKAIAFRSSLE